MKPLKHYLKRIFFVPSCNLTFDKRERQWINMVFFSRIVVCVQGDRLDLVHPIFEQKRWSDKNWSCYILGHVSISVLHNGGMYAGGEF